jgi:hypothetical protein
MVFATHTKASAVGFDVADELVETSTTWKKTIVKLSEN